MAKLVDEYKDLSSEFHTTAPWLQVDCMPTWIVQLTNNLKHPVALCSVGDMSGNVFGGYCTHCN